MSVNKGICPVCDGTLRMPASDQDRQYGLKNGWFGYSAEDDRVDCRNCGGQTQNGRPRGVVNLRKDTGEPCVHDMNSQKIGRCLELYTCKHCDFRFTIDSGD